MVWLRVRVKLFKLIAVLHLARVRTFAGIRYAMALLIGVCAGWEENDIALIAVVVAQVIAFGIDIAVIYIRNIVDD